MSTQVHVSTSFVRLHLLLSQQMPEKLLANELSASSAMLWRDALYTEDLRIMKKVWTEQDKPHYQDLANQLDIADPFAVYIMVTNYFIDMRIGENIPQPTAKKFPNEIVTDFFMYYLHEKLYKIKSIKKLIYLALEKNSPLNPYIYEVVTCVP